MEGIDYSSREDDEFIRLLKSLTLGDTLVFLLADLSVRTVARFLRLVEYGFPVALIDSKSADHVLRDLIERYSPNVMLGTEDSVIPDSRITFNASHMVTGAWVAEGKSTPVHAELAVLLTTSGSTGSPKFVKLSRSNILENAMQIVTSLGITHSDVAISSLPLFYSYGMSIVTSHALVGASLVVTDSTVLEPAFWETVKERKITTMPGVPQTYKMLKRIGFDSMIVPTLKTLTQAGGALSDEDQLFFHSIMNERGGQFFVMYGQTEASPRISCVPSTELPRKLGSVGLALSGSSFRVESEHGVELPSGEIGEIIYTGPNVMMGYAESRADLLSGDTFGETLKTGDLGYVDDEGYLFITGRIKRITKLSGARVSLDDLEATAGRIFGLHAIAVDVGEGPLIWLESNEATDISRVRQLARDLRVPPNLLPIRQIKEFPLLPNGKVDLRELTRLARIELGLGALKHD